MSRHAHHHPVRSVEEHLAAVTEALRGLAGRQESVALDWALGRVLAREVTAGMSLQPFENSQMDGFAIRAADSTRDTVAEGTEGTEGAEGTVPFLVVAPVAAGYASDSIAPGQAAPVMTGAALPPGADAVVPVEESAPGGFPPAGATVHLPAGQAAGRFVRRAGEDLAAGQTALTEGQRLTPARIGLAAALGLTVLPVRARPRVLVYTTGDEVVAPGAQRGPAQIYDANASILCAQLQEAGAEVIGAHLVNDDVESFTARLAADVRQDVDLVLTSGGVSEGAYEVIRQVLTPNGEFLHVAMQPGGPQGIAHAHGVPVLCLPGNPVSTLISFEMFVRPALSKVLGAPAPRPRLTAPLAEPVRPLPGKTQVRRAVWDGDVVRMSGGPGSHLLAAAARANALAVLAPGDAELPAGAPVDVLPLD